MTAVRTGEAIEAPFDEFDLAAKVWSIPGPRMKGGQPHRVPLCNRAVTRRRDTWDGFRFQIIKGGSRVRFYSRHGAEHTDRLPGMVKAFGKLPTRSAILDGAYLRG